MTALGAMLSFGSEIVVGCLHAMPPGSRTVLMRGRTGPFARTGAVLPSWGIASSLGRCALVCTGSATDG